MDGGLYVYSVQFMITSVKYDASVQVDKHVGEGKTTGITMNSTCMQRNLKSQPTCYGERLVVT